MTAHSVTHSPLHIPTASIVFRADLYPPRQGHGFAGNGSGPPYREVSLASMNKVRDFWAVVFRVSPALLARPDSARLGGGL